MVRVHVLGGVLFTGLVLSVGHSAAMALAGFDDPICQQEGVFCIASTPLNSGGGNTNRANNSGTDNNDNKNNPVSFCSNQERSALISGRYNVNISGACVYEWLKEEHNGSIARASVFLRNLGGGCSEEDKSAIEDLRSDVVVNQNCVRYIAALLEGQNDNKDGRNDAINREILAQLKDSNSKLGQIKQDFTGFGNKVNEFGNQVNEFGNKVNEVVSLFQQALNKVQDPRFLEQVISPLTRSGLPEPEGSGSGEGSQESGFNWGDALKLASQLPQLLGGGISPFGGGNGPLGGGNGGGNIPFSPFGGGNFPFGGNQPQLARLFRDTPYNTPLEAYQDIGVRTAKQTAIDVDRQLRMTKDAVDSAQKDLVSAAENYAQEVSDAKGKAGQLLQEAEQTLKESEGKEASLENELEALKAILKGVIANGKIAKAGHEGTIEAINATGQGIMSLQLAQLTMDNAMLESMGAISERDAIQNQQIISGIQQLIQSGKKGMPRGTSAGLVVQR